MTHACLDQGFAAASPQVRRAHHRSSAVAQLIAAAALIASTATILTALSIDMCRAEAPRPTVGGISCDIAPSVLGDPAR